ncbi:MAG TPA: sensor histidine kinase [Mycobacteriales bacterium]|nr:sensor histidine kinase [Mycobacteriales bacterium]HWB66408.1 sensor histidine kinase [Mycobacteriales bacterium]
MAGKDDQASIERAWPLDEMWAPLALVLRFAARHPLLSNLAEVLIIDLASAIPLFDGDENRWWVWVLDQLLIVPLLARRRAPNSVFLVLSALAFVQWLAHVPLAADVSLLVALYTVAARRSRREALAASAILEVGVVLASTRFVPASDGLAGSLIFLTGLVTAALFGGVAWRSHVAHLDAVVDRAAQLERERDQQARLAVIAERTRIAREMHDIVAHSLSVVVALSDGAALTNQSDPAEATEAMRQASEVGRQALSEMRRLLGVLRDDSDDAPLAPQPGLAEIGGLIDQVRAVGLSADISTAGDPRPLPPTEDAAAYRIVQESLTNALKHAREATRVDVALEWTAGLLRVEVCDDGRGSEPTGGAGHGLVGMSERVAIFGGGIEAGPLPGRGWRVSAWLPLPATAP